MSSAALHYSPPKEEHHHEDCPDFSGERQKFYMQFVQDTAGIVDLEQRIFVIEPDEHEEYVQTYNYVRMHELKKE
ncbi:hypothetical protein Tco_0731443 [Tanacetum coccineum]